MNEVFLKIVPIILIFVLGYILKKINLLKEKDGDLLLKLVFYVSLPALIIVSISNIKLSLDFIYLPIIAALIIITTFFISFIMGNLLHLQRPSIGVFLIGTMIINISFILPFIIAAYGREGFVRASLFDFGNAFLMLTFAYYLACRYGSNKKDYKPIIKKFVLFPPLWALIFAIICNLAKLKIPEVVNSFFQTLGNLTIPLIMLSLGIHLSLNIVKLLPLSLAIVIRILFGLLLGFFFVRLFNLSGLNRVIVIISSSAPVGYNTLTLSSLENLDKEFAASLVSVSILIGIIFTPFLIFVLS